MVPVFIRVQSCSRDRTKLNQHESKRQLKIKKWYQECSSLAQSASTDINNVRSNPHIFLQWKHDWTRESSSQAQEPTCAVLTAGARSMHGMEHSLKSSVFKGEENKPLSSQHMLKTVIP